MRHYFDGFGNEETKYVLALEKQIEQLKLENEQLKKNQNVKKGKKNASSTTNQR